MPPTMTKVHPCDVVAVGARLFIEPEDPDARPWRAVVSHVTGGNLVLTVDGKVSPAEIPVGAWLKCHHVDGGNTIEFRSLIVEVVDANPMRIMMRPREATPRPDRRRHRRVPVSATGRVIPEGGRGQVSFTATLEDISIGGVRFVWRGQLAEDEVFDLVVDLPTGKLNATAAVVGTDKRGDVNVVRAFFVSLDSSSKSAIRQLVANSPL